MEKYYLIGNIESGMYIEEFENEESLLEDINEYLEDMSEESIPNYLSKFPENPSYEYLSNNNDDRIIIKGKIITPIKKEVVTKFCL